MGGVGAWKEREKEQKEFRTKWDREEMVAERERREEEADKEGREYVDYDENPAVEEMEGEKEEEDTRNDDDVSFGFAGVGRTPRIILMCCSLLRWA